MTRLLLNGSGYACDTVASGPEVEQCLKRQAYVLLLSDIDRPGNQPPTTGGQSRPQMRANPSSER
jgi:CheY-like chemotaxis protein